ncbi:hypothetical protein ACH47C_16990 [Streptomyces rishiriensis]|uniref:hypothetical protein n=1 Tax=Streptomyces rishiriensis TaxID=68264 RepID=UPI003401771B
MRANRSGRGVHPINDLDGLMLYDVEMAVELWKPGLPEQLLQGLLDAYAQSVKYPPEHVDEPL